MPDLIRHLVLPVMPDLIRHLFRPVGLSQGALRTRVAVEHSPRGTLNAPPGQPTPDLTSCPAPTGHLSLSPTTSHWKIVAGSRLKGLPATV